MTIERPMFPPRAESPDAFSAQPAIGQRPADRPAIESPKLGEGLSRRSMLGAIAVTIPITTASALAGNLDAKLIELGTRFEPLVDQYYVVRKRWGRLLVLAHAEHDLKFGDPADRNYEYTPENSAAFADSCLRFGVREADDQLSAIHKEMKPLANAINASPVNSIEGLRAKALVALWEVAPQFAEQAEFSFDDAYPFQQLFTAIAELCGLTAKMAATGYALPDIAMVDDDPDESAGAVN